MSTSKQQERIKIMALTALFIALNIVFTRLLSLNLGFIRISMGMIPIHIAGYLLGPVSGFLVGFTGDLIGYFINSTGGPFNIWITLITGLRGLIAGLVVLMFKKKINITSVIVSNIFTTVICSIILMGIVLSTILGLGIQDYLAPRAVGIVLQNAVLTGIEIVLLPALMSVKNYLPKDRTIEFRKRSIIDRP